MNITMSSYKMEATKKMISEIIVARNSLYQLNEMGVFSGLRKTSKHLLVTDKNLEKLYLRPILESIEKAGLSVRLMVVPASETSKSFQVYSQLTQKSLDYSFDKHSVIFSLGGGVINNLAGFLASTLYRGIGLIHFPTSLLAQVDAAVDFKQAINFEHGKNLIGSYYAASKIIIDTSVLETLDKRLICDGMAEVLKHSICQNSNFLDYLMANCNNLMDPAFLESVVEQSIKMKLEVMSGDMDSDYDETLKQYGHAIGHAIEHLSDGIIYHGEAIAIGMAVSAEIALILDYTDEQTVEKHYKSFEAFNLPTQVPNGLALADIWEKIRYDKHFLDGKAYMGLLKNIGVMAPTTSGDFGHYIEQSVVYKAIEINRSRNLSNR
jgi:3-dehydroquinate synthase